MTVNIQNTCKNITCHNEMLTHANTFFLPCNIARDNLCVVYILRVLLRDILEHEHALHITTPFIHSITQKTTATLGQTPELFRNPTRNSFGCGLSEQSGK